jgi:D-alanine-D-alanine ligase
MSKRSIWVLMGGPSAEHSVSLVSGEEVVKNLDLSKYEVFPIYISKDYIWAWSHSPLAETEQAFFSEEWFLQDLHKKSKPSRDELPECDQVFNALHGFWGEDGRVQALLEYWSLPYTGSNVLSSALAMDKIRSKEIYRHYNIPTAKSASISSPNDLDNISLGYPLFIKNPIGGSSLQMGKAHSLLEAKELSIKLLLECDTLLVEEFISGQESSCGYLESIDGLEPTEILFEGFFDFKAKYQGASQEITPARFGTEVNKKISDLAKECHKALGCRAYSRTDIIMRADGELFVIETNTLPGLTPQSLLPQQAANAGIGYRQLLDIILEKSLD